MVALGLVIVWPAFSADWRQKWEVNYEFRICQIAEWPNFPEKLLVDFDDGPTKLICANFLVLHSNGEQHQNENTMSQTTLCSTPDLNATRDRTTSPGMACCLKQCHGAARFSPLPSWCTQHTRLKPAVTGSSKGQQSSFVHYTITVWHVATFHRLTRVISTPFHALDNAFHRLVNGFRTLAAGFLLLHGHLN